MRLREGNTAINNRDRPAAATFKRSQYNLRERIFRLVVRSRILVPVGIKVRAKT